MKSFYTYILFSSEFSRSYIGQCEDIDIRLERHNNGFVTSTKPWRPWNLVGFIEKPTRSEAMALEKNSKI